MKLFLMIPDTHRPYHHQKAYNLMLKVGAALNPDCIILLGDYADIYGANSHGKHAGVLETLEDEVMDVMAGLQELDDVFPDAKKVFLEGNHEYRLERYINSSAPALFGLTSIKDILEMDKRPNWIWIPYGPNQMYQVGNSALWARHEPLGPTAKASASKAMCSFIHGHTHRIESAYSVGLKGDQFICYSPGWLGDKRKDKIFGYVKQHHQWNLGFSFVYVDEKTGLFYVHIVNIIEDSGKVSCVANGVKYEL
jgi:predicted phosphodiesterase